MARTSRRERGVPTGRVRKTAQERLVEYGVIVLLSMGLWLVFGEAALEEWELRQERARTEAALRRGFYIITEADTLASWQTVTVYTVHTEGE